MSTVRELLNEAASRLEPVTETPRLDAEILLAHAAGLSRASLIARNRESVDAPEFQRLLTRRLGHEPLAYILGRWEFFSLRFLTRAPVLVPRPETEHLVEAALDFLGNHPARVLELGVGGGCVAVSIAKNAPKVQVTAIDASAAALELARENAALHGVSVEFRRGDWFSPFRRDRPALDLIVSNPPYVPDGEWPTLSPVIRLHEDSRALLAGADGLDAIRALAAEAPAFLRPGGALALEVGEEQALAVEALLNNSSFDKVQFRKDLAGIDRVVIGEKHV